MSAEPPYVSCLCPTYRRPQLLSNSLACFLAQDYPADRRELIILDDDNQYATQTGDGWQLLSIPRRFHSLPEKCNAVAGLARGEILIVWDDDDIYLPHHISSHVRSLQQHPWSKPSKVLSLYTGKPEIEDSRDRFHGSIAFRREAYESVNGWPLTLRGDFDQQFMRRLALLGPPGDPTRDAEPAYVFRWATAAYHSQGFMSTPADPSWYAAVAEATHHESFSGRLKPQLDGETEKMLRPRDAR